MSYRCDVCGTEQGSSGVATVSRHRSVPAVWWCLSCLDEGKRLVRQAHAQALDGPGTCSRCTMYGRTENGPGRCFHGRAPMQVSKSGARIAPEVGPGAPPEWCPKPPAKRRLPVFDPPAKKDP